MAVSKQAEKLQWAHDAAYNLIMTQLDLGGAFEEDSESQKRFGTYFAFGYMFGFTDSLMQIAGIADEVETLAQMTIAFVRMFGPDKGAKMLGKCIRIQAEPEFKAASMLGRQEIRVWLAHADANTPQGLAQYLTGSGLGPIAYA